MSSSPTRRACTACGTDFQPPRKAPAATLCRGCYDARKRALASLPATAEGKWAGILTALGIDGDKLTQEHGPCPGCGGTDRFRFDDQDGRGTWVCGGGGDLTAGDGFALLTHALGLSAHDAYLAVADQLGVPGTDSAARSDAHHHQRDDRTDTEADEHARQQADTAAKAAAVWEQSVPATDNPYLRRKGVAETETLRQIDADTAAKVLGYRPKANGHHLDGHLVVVPLHRDGELTSLELIDAQGHKAALKGRGTKAGAYWTAQPLEGLSGPVVIAEGVATALSVREATGLPVVAAMSVSNYVKTVSGVRAANAALSPILAADLNKKTGEPIAAATQAARRFRPAIPVAAPDFGAERPEGCTDFNDLHQARGLDAVREQITIPEPDEGEATDPAVDTIERAIEQLPDDAGAALTEEAVDAWAAIYGRSAAEYERLRARAKQAGARVAEIDRAIGARSKYAKERGAAKTEQQSQSYTSYTSCTDAGSSDTKNYTTLFESCTSCTDPLPPAPGVLVRETDRGPRLAVASDAAITVAEVFQGRFAHCARADVWHRYTGAHWEPMPAAAPELHEALTRWLFAATGRVGFTPKYADSVLTLVERAGLRPLPVPSAAIPFANGLLDVETGALMPVSPQTASTWSLPYEYRQDADCPRVQAWLLEAVGGDRDVRELLRAWLAALLRGGAHLQRLLHLIGPGGTGKSTFLRLVEALVGTRNCVTTDLKELETNRFETAALYGKRAALITDSDKYGGSVNVLKAITGQDPVRLERKHVQQSGSFIFDGLVIVASNEPLATTDYTSGLERRRCTVLFERRVTDDQKAAWAAQGGEQAILHAELPGVVNWALNMPVADMEAMIRNPPEHTARANLEAMRHGNPCADWLVECCVPQPGTWTQVGKSTELRDPGNGRVYYEHADTQLYPNYLAWCRASGRAPLSLRRFRSVVVDASTTLGHPVMDARRASGQGIDGLRLRRPDEPLHPWRTAVGTVAGAGNAASAVKGAPKHRPQARTSAGSGRSVGSGDHITPRAQPAALKASADFQAPAGDAEVF